MAEGGEVPGVLAFEAVLEVRVECPAFRMDPGIPVQNYLQLEGRIGSSRDPVPVEPVVRNCC